jgi:hypothetical protein
MIERFRKTRRLLSGVTRKTVSSPREAWLLMRMAWWVAVLSAAARLYSLPRALDLLLAADFFIFTPVCWKRAAVLHRYLSRSGISTRIIFGVRNESGGKVAGHAWLEREGHPILENTPPEYVVTYSFP